MKTATIRRVLIYKRTHWNDPCPDGCFGCCNCMGEIRDREFDAVIGVGGLSSQPARAGMAGKITWIGIGPDKSRGKCNTGDIVTLVRFRHYKTFGDQMPDFREFAPRLASRMYDGKIRHLMADNRHPEEMREVMQILQLARKSKPSICRKTYATQSRRRICGTRKETCGE